MSGREQTRRPRSELFALVIGFLTFCVVLPPRQATAATDEYSELRVELTTSELAGGLPLDEHEDVLLSSEIAETFDLIGLLWDAGSPEHAFVRVRTGSSWSEWIELGIHDDPEGDTGGSDPYWSAGSDGFQVALAGDVSGVRVGLVVSPPSFAIAQPSLGPAQLTATAAPSGIHARSEWDVGGDCRPDGEPVQYSDVQGIVIHHTVSGATSPSDVPRAIDAICNFHVNGRGWSDIGYNAIVDRYGEVWEARAGGVATGVSGAHAAGFNSLTQGVAMLGDFSSAPPTSAQESSLVDLLDWMTGWYLIDPDDIVTLYSRSDGSKFDEGEAVTLPTIMGHRDLGATSCPGDKGYARLPSIRSSVEPIPRNVGSSPGDELMSYNAVNGRLRIESLHSTGIIDRPVGYGFVSTGWTTVVNLDLDGDIHDEILFYNRGSGRVVMHNLQANGSLGSLIRQGTLGLGWTTVEPADTEGDGDDELFFYRISDGRFGFYQVSSNGQLGVGIRAGSFGRGWTSVEPVDIDGNGEDEIMFYRKSDGRFAFYHLSSDGFIGSAIRVGNFGVGWDTIEPTDFTGNGDDELIFYRYHDGRYAVYDLDTGGFIGSNINVGTWPDQWTSIASPELD